MSPRPSSSCSMLPLVEARRDGRLQARESDSVERHLRGCSECRALLADLDTIGELGRRLGREGALTVLDKRRHRLALLRAAAAPPSVRGRRQRAKVALPATLAVAATLLLVVVLRQPAGDGLDVAGRWGLDVDGLSRDLPLAAAVTPAPTARFLRRRAQTEMGRVERVQLFDGAIELQVAALGESERFLVVTDDGEVEVRGTRFRVVADGGALRSVVVQEGRVEVRHAGVVLLLEPGERWSVEAAVVGEGASTAQLPAAADRAPAVRVAVAARDAGEAADVVDPSHEPQVDPVATTSDTTEADPRAREFARAVGALEEGEYREAGRALEAFAREHPSDERAEDAHFLRIVALQRQGRHAAAAQAARSYLSLFPTGARRAEAESIARRGSERP